MKISIQIPLFAAVLAGTLACGTESTDIGIREIGNAQTATFSQQNPNDTAPDSFADIMAFAKQQNLYEKSFGTIIQVLGEQFRGKPYVAGQLDAPVEETLVVNFEAFDCVLYIETVLALARGVALQDYTYETFLRNLEGLRYRDGSLDGYCSRLHYFSEWIDNNEKRGLVENLTADLGGIQLDKRLNFMSRHRDAYVQLFDDTLFEGVVEMEEDLSDLKIFYIPQDRISTIYGQLEPGDLIAAATDIEGLDVAHTGMVYAFPDGRMGFQHASVSDGVTIARDLQTYIQGVKRQIGIVVIRARDPR